ncbi:MAG: hypothetical protein ABIR96_03295 [Bdellovibrionota bacterium]
MSATLGFSVCAARADIAAPLAHGAPSNEKFIDASSPLLGCSPSERATIKSTYEELLKNFRRNAIISSPRGRGPAPLLAPLAALENSLLDQLVGRDPVSCLADAGIPEEEACLLLSAKSWKFSRASPDFSGDAVVNRDRISMPSKTNPDLDYVVFWNEKRKEYSSQVMLVDRHQQQSVGILDAKNLLLQNFEVQRGTRDYRGHQIATSSPAFTTKSFAYANAGLKSPLKISEGCSELSSKIDRFMSDSAARDPNVGDWQKNHATLTNSAKIGLSLDAADEGADVGAANVYESGKAAVEGVKFFWDYLANPEIANPLEPGSKTHYRTLINESLGKMGSESFQECLKELCPGSKNPTPQSCGVFAATRARACVGGKIAKHMGKEISDYVMTCLTGGARPDLGISAGAESFSACLADISVATASFIPVASATRGASIAGQAAYRSMLEATKTLSPVSKKILRTWAKRIIRTTAAGTLVPLDLAVNQLPTSPSDLKGLEKYLKNFLQNPSLLKAQRAEAEKLLAQVKDARRSPEAVAEAAGDSRVHLQKELERAYEGSDTQWYKQNLEQDLDQALLERQNFQKYLDEGLKPGEKVYWVQQRELKELNEKLWDIGGTEYYLMTLDRELGKLLKEHPELGRVVHRNYKDRVIVSSLSAEDFEKQVLAPLRKQVSTEIGAVKERLGTSYLWSDYMEDSLKIGQGSSLENAFLDLHLGAQGKTFADWKTEISKSRQLLEEHVQSQHPGASIEKYLRQARKLREDPEALAKWFASEKLAPETGNEVLKYLEDLRVADFLPLAKPMTEADQKLLAHSQAVLKSGEASPLSEVSRIESVVDESWIFQRTHFLKEAQKARYMVATDIQGLGEKAMLAQDKWLKAGADPKTISTVYADTTKFLNGRYSQVLEGLKKILGQEASIGVYRSGDDALWSLPEMTIEQKNAVDALFQAQSDMYHAVVDVNAAGGPSAVADAVHGAREKLFSDKAVLKKVSQESAPAVLQPNVDSLRIASHPSWGTMTARPVDSKSLNPVFEVRTEHGDVVGIMKPKRLYDKSFSSLKSYAMKWDLLRMKRSFENGAALNRDAAAHQLSEAYGFSNVPFSTTLVTDQSVPASFQEFLRGYKEGASATPAELTKVPRAEIQKMYLLDAVLGSQDRHARNWMIDDKGSMKLIDNEFSLPLTPAPRWGHYTDINASFPQAKGPIEAELAKKILDMTANKQTDTLAAQKIPAEAIRLANLRLEKVQEMIRAGSSMEEITEAFNNVAFMNYKGIFQVVFNVRGIADSVTTLGVLQNRAGAKQREPAVEKPLNP